MRSSHRSPSSHHCRRCRPSRQARSRRPYRREGWASAHWRRRQARRQDRGRKRNAPTRASSSRYKAALASRPRVSVTKDLFLVRRSPTNRVLSVAQSPGALGSVQRAIRAWRAWRSAAAALGVFVAGGFLGCGSSDSTPGATCDGPNCYPPGYTSECGETGCWQPTDADKAFATESCTLTADCCVHDTSTPTGAWRRLRATCRSVPRAAATRIARAASATGAPACPPVSSCPSSTSAKPTDGACVAARSVAARPAGYSASPVPRRRIG